MFCVLIKVLCPHCETPNVKKNVFPPVRCNGQQIFFAKIVVNNLLGYSIHLEYKYQGANPWIKSQVCQMAMRGSGIRDTTEILKMSVVTVILEL